MSEMNLSQNPIFVVGYPRSGTTLLQALLATQDDLVTFPETHFFSTAFEGKRDFYENIDLTAARKTLEKIAQRSGIEFEANFADSLAEGGQVPVKALFEALVRKLLPGDVNPACRWLEKTPSHGLHMEQILHFYPEARFVGIIRNPFFAIYSNMKYLPPKVDAPLTQLSKQWVHHVRVFEGFQAEHPKAAYRIRYEDLAQAPETEILNICNFLGFEFDRGKLESFQQKAESIIQPFEHWKQDVKSSQIFVRDDKPQKCFSAGKILKIQSIVQEKMVHYGYRPEHPLLQKIYNLFV